LEEPPASITGIEKQVFFEGDGGGWYGRSGGHDPVERLVGISSS